MNETDDDVVEPDELDLLFEAVLAGARPGPGAPSWSRDLTRLVDGARAPGTPAELAAEPDVVGRMVALRVAVVAHNGLAHNGVSERVREVEPEAPEPLPVPRRAAAGSPRHARSRAKHAAPRPQSSDATTARNVGRILAFKAAAITTGVVVGTVAAAAATTGIVHNVVVPAIVREAADVKLPKTPVDPPAEAPDVERSASDDDQLEVTVQVPSCQLTPVCSPLTPASPSPSPTPARPSGASVTTTTTERPTTTTTERPETTTTTTPDVTTATTEADPETTTTSTTETTTTTEPEPVGPRSLPLPPEPIDPSPDPEAPVP